jgi:ABC-type multidrug transport system fused ATPase/permease subunit
MNQSKFSLADVLSVLAALVFGFVCFMGANFMNINNDKVWGMPHTAGCIAMAVVCSGLLFTTAFGAKFLKRTSSNFKSSFVLEVILLILFVLFAVFFASKYSPFPHFFTVLAQKSEIISKLQRSISQAENMFAAYESYADNRVNLYETNLKSDVAIGNPNKLRSYGFDYNGPPFEKQIESKKFKLDSDLFPANYSNTTANNGIKEEATAWLQDANSPWKPIGIVSVVCEIDKNSSKWLNTLVTLSQVLGQGEQSIEGYEFSYSLNSFDDIKIHFTKLYSPTPLAIGFAGLVYLLMLLAWIVTKRSTKSDCSFRSLIRAKFSQQPKKERDNFNIDY